MKLYITRNTSGVTIRATATEGGITVSYSLKAYASSVARGIRDAKAGAAKLLAEAQGAA